MLLSEAVDLFTTTKEAEGLSPRTVEDYSRKLFMFVRWADDPDVETINVEMVRGYTAHLLARKQAKELASATVATTLRPVKVFCRWAVNETPPLLAVDPFKRVKIPRVEGKLHDVLSDEDVRRILGACDLNTHEGRRNYAMVCFLLDTGVRVGELCNLKRTDVAVKTRSAVVFGKGRRQRTVFFSAFTAAALTRYTSRTPDMYRSEWMWGALRQNVGGPLHPSGVQQMLAKLKRLSGLTARMNPHTFRHTFATNYLRAGGDLNSLMRLMGHADLSILQTYLNLVNDDLKSKHDQYSPLARAVGGRR